MEEIPHVPILHSDRHGYGALRPSVLVTLRVRLNARNHLIVAHTGELRILLTECAIQFTSTGISSGSVSRLGVRNRTHWRGQDRAWGSGSKSCNAKYGNKTLRDFLSLNMYSSLANPSEPRAPTLLFSLLRCVQGDDEGMLKRSVSDPTPQRPEKRALPINL
jgi:hypothetical protein